MISQVLPAANSARKGPTIQMPDQLTILGLESSCDDTAAAVVRGAPDDRADIMSSVVLGQADLHGEFGGVVPELAARAHAEKIDICVEAALAKAGIGLSDVDGVAVTAGPGLIGGVLSGVMCAKGLATASRKPLIGVNHLAGHALTPRMTDAIVYPYLMLLVSGGHCQFLIVHGCDEFTRLGGTIDDAPGEAFDKSARLLGLTQPGGPAVEHAAKSGDPARFRFPRPLIDRQNCDMSYSGLKTAVRRARDKIIAQNGGLTEVDQADVCAGFQAAVADVMAAKSEMACEAFTAQTGLSRGVLAVAGGVAANLTIREALVQSATNSGFEFVAPPLIYCTDNAAMIAWAGLERMAAGQTDDMSLAARPRWPLDPNAAPMLGSGKRGAKA